MTDLDLKKLSKSARKSQTMRRSTSKASSNRSSSKTSNSSSTATSNTGNAKARKAAGIKKGSLDAAKRQAKRRREIAQLSIELEPSQKAELLKAAKRNGHSLRQEVLTRLGFE